MFLTGFIAIVTGTMPAGLLIQIAENLQVTEAMAGQFVTVFSLGALVAAMPLTAITRNWPRKRVLLLAVGT